MSVSAERLKEAIEFAEAIEFGQIITDGECEELCEESLKAVVRIADRDTDEFIAARAAIAKAAGNGDE